MRTRYLLCVLLGIVLASAVFELRAAFEAYQVLDARVDRIESFLGQMAQAMSK